MTPDNVTDILSKEDKILHLSDNAIRDIYARQIALKIAENRKGYIKESSELFKGLKANNPEHNLYEALREIDGQLYLRLNRADSSIEDAIIQEFTKEIESDQLEKTDVMRKKLIETSKCSGVPRAILAHENIEAWVETERL